MPYFLKLINFSIFFVCPLKPQSWFLTVSNIVLCWRIFWNPSSFPIAFSENFKNSSYFHGSNRPMQHCEQCFAWQYTRVHICMFSICVYVNFVSIGVYVNFSIDSFFTYPKTSNKKGICYTFIVLVNNSFIERFYEKKIIFWQFFHFL